MKLSDVHAGGTFGASAPRSDAAGETIFREEFLKLVQREKRRTDRTHSPLSVAVFHFEADRGASDRKAERLLDSLNSVKRATDCVTRLEDRAVAVLLLDTDAAGLQSFLDKALPAVAVPGLGCSAATYPGPLFDACIAMHSSVTGRRTSGAGDTFPLRAHGYRLKRYLDIAGAVTALLLLAPLMLAAATALMLSSSGPVIFRQSRLGRSGIPFVLYKFRSMRNATDDKIHRDFVAGLIKGTADVAADQRSAPLYKLTTDPRITRVGRLLRKTSVDELPQLFNVLKGEMSLVGPRPAMAYEVENYQPWHRRRVLEMKPGLTGIWQVEGRSQVSFDDMVRMDLRYLRECSLAFDVRILLRTVWVVLTCKGAD